MGFAKWIGGALGWALSASPIGGLVGFAMGAMLDNYRGELVEPPVEGQRSAGPRPGATTAGDLAMSLVVLTAALMKADGQATRAELDHVRRFFTAQFGQAQAAQLLVVLRDVLKRDIPLVEVCTQVRHNMPHPLRLQLMHYLIGLAHADGRVDRAELDMLRSMTSHMGISAKDLASLSAMFRTEEPDAAYTILEVSRDADDETVKQAYRRMAKKHHPDKVASLGEDVQRAAAEKFKRVQDAYERIQRERGMK